MIFRASEISALFLFIDLGFAKSVFANASFMGARLENRDLKL
jgi:hypothetical protein